MNLWLTVQDLAKELKCSEQYIRYLISGRNRKYTNEVTKTLRIKKDLPKINPSMIRCERIGFSEKRIKYYIHNSVLSLLKNSNK
jgi:hypothetical protein